MSGLRTVVAVTVLVVAAVATPAQAAGADIRRVSVSADGRQGDRDSGGPVISRDGRYVAFASAATALVAGDTNNTPDIFVADRRTGAVSRANVSSSGAQAHHLTDEGSFGPSISDDGRYVAFASFADNLVPGDTNNALDGFVRDRRTGRTIRVTLNTAGGQAFGGGVSISGDGRYVAFVSTPENIFPGSTDSLDAVFVRDLRTGAVSRVDVSTSGGTPDSISGVALISGDGRHVVFQSYGSGLDPRDTNTEPDVFLRDLDTGVTELVSVTSAGVSGNGGSGGFAVSADGRFVAFGSYASDLIPGDTNGVPDAFVRDLRTGVTHLVSVAAGGGPSDAYGSSPSSVSDDGRFVGFQSYATNLVPGDTNGALDAFVRDMRSGTTILVSVGRRGAQGNGDSYAPAMTGDSRWVAFASSAGNLVPGDTNRVADVFVRPRH
jgi:Tol biopolymer transport system component